MAVDAPKSATIRAGLAKKATFEASAAELLAWMQHDKAFAGSLEAHELAARCATLLRTRYSRSALAFWKASLEVFKVLVLAKLTRSAVYWLPATFVLLSSPGLSSNFARGQAVEVLIVCAGAANQQTCQCRAGSCMDRRLQ